MENTGNVKATSVSNVILGWSCTSQLARCFILSFRWARMVQHWRCLRLQQLSYIKIMVNPYLGKGRDSR